MGLVITLADVIMMDLAVNSIAYIIGIGFIVFLLVLIVKSIIRDRRYENQTDEINALYLKNKNLRKAP